MPEFAGPVVVVDPGNFSPQYTANLCSSLTRLGVDVTLVTSPPQFGEMPSPRGYRVETCFFRRVSGAGLVRSATAGSAGARMLLKACAYPFGLAAARRLLGRQKTPGIIHYQWVHAPILDGRLVAGLRKSGWRAVATAHEFSSPPPFSAIWKRQARRFYQSVDAVVVHTARLAEQAQAELSIPSPRLHVIARGGLGVFEGAERSREDARKYIGIGGSGPVLLFFGMIKPNKGLMHLLHAMPHILEQHPEACLAIAGEPIEKFDSYRETIERLGITGSVVTRLGYVRDEDVGAYFQAADLVVLPHTEASLSGVAWVAMGFGRPIVGTDVGGLSDLVEDGASGRLVPPGSPGALSGAIIPLLRDRARLERMGQLGRQRSQARRNWDATATETLQLYRRLINGNSG